MYAFMITKSRIGRVDQRTYERYAFVCEAPQPAGDRQGEFPNGDRKRD